MKNQILFTKYSNERSEKFAIRTQIICDGNHKKQVVKSPVTAASAEHVRKMPEWEKCLNDIYEGTGLSMNVCHQDGESVRFEFLEGITLERELDAYLEKKDMQSFLNCVGEFFTVLRKARNQKKFVKSEQFIEVFGSVDLSDDLMCAPVTDIDMVFGNVMIINGAMQLIDYEWTFDFPIPINFVIYRAIHYYTRLGNTRPQLLSMNLYEQFGITESEVVQYEKMEQCFQKYIIKDFTPIRLMYDRISPGCIAVEKAVGEYTKKSGRGNLQVFWDLGAVFTEKNSVKLRPKKEGYFEIELLLPKEAEWIRLDPGEDCGILYIETLSLDGENVRPSAPEGWVQDAKTVIFTKDDPQILVHNALGKQVTLCFRARMEKVAGEYTEKLINILGEGKDDKEKLQQLQTKYAQLSLEMEQLKAENNKLRHKLRAMEETKVWKVYRKYRDAIEKGK